MDRIWENIGTIAAGVIGVAILAVLVSQKAQTPAVIGAAGSAFSNILSAATGPVTGSVAAPVNQTSATGGNILTGSLASLPSLPTLSG